MRLDYVHTGTTAEESFALDGLVLEGAWPGPLVAPAVDILDASIGTDNLLHTEPVHITLRFSVLNLTNQESLYLDRETKKPGGSFSPAGPRRSDLTLYL